jgi:signal peptidase I
LLLLNEFAGPASAILAIPLQAGVTWSAEVGAANLLNVIASAINKVGLRPSLRETTLISLAILIPLFLLAWLAMAWVLARSARAAGSSRGRFRVGLLAVAILFALGIFFRAMDTLRPTQSAIQALSLTWTLLIVHLIVIFVVLRQIFALTTKRTFIPFSVCIVLALVESGLALLVIRPFVVEAFVIPTKSMSPTIDPGDRFVVNKLIQPRRWDLVAYWNPGPHPTIYCKRLIGLPGERLRFDDGRIFINDQPVTMPPVLAGRCHAHPPSLSKSAAPYQDGQTIVLGNNDFFFIGDNVAISADSRLLGPSPASSLVGVVDLIYWPLSKAGIVR